MAKRKGEEPEEEEYDFIPPDFDEDAFIHKEMVSFRTTSTLIIVGVLAALASWLLFRPVGGADAGWWLGIAIVAAAFAALKPLYRLLGFDISHYGRREWLGTGFLLFFTWLAFFMVFLNPPFSDQADPEVHLYTSPGAVEAGEEARIDIFLSDNDGFSAPTFTLQGPGGAQLADEGDLTRVAPGHYSLERTFEAGTYTLTASTTDPAGHTTTQSVELEAVADQVRVFPEPLEDLDDPTGQVLVTVADGIDVWAVYADFDGDRTTSEDRVYFQYEEERGGYQATATHAGWQAGTNNFTIIVEERHRFEGQHLIAGAVLTEGPFQIQVEQPGDYDPRSPKGTQSTVAPAPGEFTPGLGPLGILAALGAVALLRRR